MKNDDLDVELADVLEIAMKLELIEGLDIEVSFGFFYCMVE